MKVILVAAARPNFMKVAPLMRAIQKHNEKGPSRKIEALLVHTGQHYDYEMSQIFFEDLALPKPDVYLGVGSGTHAEQTGKVMIELEKVLIAEKPDLVTVVGDVNSTLAAALAAVKLHIPVAHVEAGVRCGDLKMPEEVNRLLSDHISDYLLTTSKYDDDNLKKEGILPRKIFRVGNTMADSLFFNKSLAEKSNILSKLGLNIDNYALLTIHRPCNVDKKEPLQKIINDVSEISQKLTVVFPAHPRTRTRLKEFDLTNKLASLGGRILLIDPLGYLDFLYLQMHAKFVITDSGGIQVETTVLGIPCLTLRDTASWPITIKQGTNTLIGRCNNNLQKEAVKILDGRSRKGKCPILWDGKAAERIVEVLSTQPL